MNNSLSTIPICSLKQRVYSPDYLFFKLLNSTYLRLLIGPGILLNTLCLIVFSRPRLSNKSTTIGFLRFLAIFDILSITLKYIRAEINYQSIVKHKDIIILSPVFCKTLYVCMNTCISIAMWTIVLMSVDKAVAVSYPLKSGIWVTQKRASYICYLISFILFLANLSFITLAGVLPANNNQKYCGLTKDSLIVDILTASILPIALITAANIVIAVILNRVSRISFNWSTYGDHSNLSSPDLNILRKKRLSRSFRYQSSPNASIETDSARAIQRRTSAQVTRMLLAVTLSLILFNIPNTIIFLFTKINDTRQLLFGRSCLEISDDDIKLYKIGFYSSVIQDILSDLPHIVNFFLYCLAGKKFRSIFVNEVRHFFIEIHLIKRKQRRFTHNGNIINPELTNASAANYSPRPISPRNPLLKRKNTINVLFNGSTNQLILCHQNYDISINDKDRFHKEHLIRIYSTMD